MTPARDRNDGERNGDERPARDGPARERPLHERPLHERPARERRARETPARDGPGGERPAREAYRDLLVALMAADPRIHCLDTDTGLFAGADFGPAADRYLNLGIAEHTMMGVAAGLAASGKIPFVNTMATFATTRALEAVKIDVAYNELPVRVVATHGGLSAGHLGPTHHALEDLAIMRVLPGFTVVVPADARAAEEAVRQSIDLPGPVYIRVGRKATAALLPEGTVPAIGRAQPLRSGGDIAILACGPHPVHAALRAAGRLAGAGVEAAVLNVHTLKPLDVDAVISVAERVPAVITVEEHWRSGGLGGAIAETLAEHAPVRLARIGMPETFAQVVGDQEHLLRHYDITDERVVGTALSMLEGTRHAADLSRV